MPVQVSDWDRYAAEEYELLVAEEGGADHQDDMYVFMRFFKNMVFISRLTIHMV